MKKILLILMVLFLGVMSCKKDNTMTNDNVIAQKQAEYVHINGLIDERVGKPMTKETWDLLKMSGELNKELLSYGVKPLGITQRYWDVHCYWLHWGICCRESENCFNNNMSCPICGGPVAINLVTICP